MNMSFSKYFNCCFPKNREALVTKQEEVYDIKYSSEEKKIDYTPGVKIASNSLNPEEDLFEKKVKLGVKNKLSNKSIPKNIEGSFSSFGKKVSERGNEKAKKEESLTLLQSINPRLDGSDQSDKKNDTKAQIKEKESQKSQNSTNKGVSKVLVEESTFDVYDYQGKITDEDIKNAGVLQIEEIMGNLLNNNKLKINAAGLINSLRKGKDGVTFFGKNIDAPINDYNLAFDNSNQGPHSFIIYYKKDINKFFLKSYRDKIFTGQIHIKVDPKIDYTLTKKEIVLLSENYFQITPAPSGLIEIQNLGASNVRENDTGKFTYDPDETKTITIGRDKKCTISYSGDKSFSKIQATISYDSENKTWQLKDGSVEKPSTNGCWIYAIHSFEIHDNTIFQLGNSRFKIVYCK